jgi:hypothetical protein
MKRKRWVKMVKMKRKKTLRRTTKGLLLMKGPRSLLILETIEGQRIMVL